jgi:hypothetical protein
MQGSVDPRSPPPVRRLAPPRLLGLLVGILVAIALGIVALIALSLVLVLAGVHIFSVHETHVITLLAGGASLLTFAGVAVWWLTESLFKRPRPSGRRLGAGGAVIAMGVGCIVAGTAYVYGSALASAPENERPPAVTGVVRVGRVLRGDPGRWEPSDVELSYRWTRCDRASRRCRPIPGARRTTYRVRLADAGSRLLLAVVGRNGAGRTTATSEATGIVRR